MKLIYLSGDNLRNTNFIKELVHFFEPGTRALMVHDHFGSIQDTRFVTKRLSALFSENMVVTNSFSGDQRHLLAMREGNLDFRQSLVASAMETVSLFIFNPIVASTEGPVPGDPASILKLVRSLMPVEETLLFPKNSKSPLAASRTLIEEGAELEKLTGIYEEELAILELAKAILPVILAAPENFRGKAS